MPGIAELYGGSVKNMEDGRTMRVVITGASSFLGRALVRELEKNGSGRFEITALRHSFEEAPKQLPEQADAWVHFAWAGVGSAGRSDRSIQDYNIEMSMAALKKAAELGCTRFLFAGSQAEYGRAEPAEEILTDGKLPEKIVLRQREDAVCLPQSKYGKAKLAFGQRAARWTADWNADDVPQRLRFIHMRIFSVYGPGDHAGSLLQSCMEHFRKNETMEFGNCTQDWDYLYIDDAARAVSLLLQSETAEGIYNAASGDIRPLREYVGEVKKLLHSQSRLLFGVRGDNAEGAVSLRPSVRKIREAVGFYPNISFSEGIRRMNEAE